jgi:hypothetical protein
MAIPKPHQSGWCPPLIRKLLALSVKAVLCATLIVVFGTSVATPAGAEPNSGSGDPDPFGGISCSCSQTAPTDGPVAKQQISQGIHQGLFGQEPST